MDILIFHGSFSDLMSVEEIHAELQDGYDNIKTGRVQDVAAAFVRLREKHFFSIIYDKKRSYALTLCYLFSCDCGNGNGYLEKREFFRIQDLIYI